METKRLIELAEIAKGKTNKETTMIINHKVAIEFLAQFPQENKFDKMTFYPSFFVIDVPEFAYVENYLGVYELNRIELLRDMYVWAYSRNYYGRSEKSI